MTTTPRQIIAKRYELMDLVGRGAHGVVFRAHDQQLGDDVAIKMLSRDVAGDPQYAERLRREWKALAALDGTAAVRARDMCVAPGGALCLVMEMLEGANLDDVLARLEARGDRMSNEQVLAIVRPVVDTLEVAHSAGIVHRDLKPGNIFLLSQAAGGGVRLLDFGLASLSQTSTLTGTGIVMGSPSYIAPETWEGEKERIGAKADVYSLGTIVFRMFGGRVPFEGQTLQQKYLAATRGARPSLRALRPDLPRSIDRWVKKALAIDPADRYASAREFYDALARAIDGGDLLGDDAPLSAAWRKATRMVKRWVGAETDEDRPTVPHPVVPVGEEGSISRLTPVSEATPALPSSEPTLLGVGDDLLRAEPVVGEPTLTGLGDEPTMLGLGAAPPPPPSQRSAEEEVSPDADAGPRETEPASAEKQQATAANKKATSQAKRARGKKPAQRKRTKRTVAEAASGKAAGKKASKKAATTKAASERASKKAATAKAASKRASKKAATTKAASKKAASTKAVAKKASKKAATAKAAPKKAPTAKAASKRASKKAATTKAASEKAASKKASKKAATAKAASKKAATKPAASKASKRAAAKKTVRQAASEKAATKKTARKPAASKEAATKPAASKKAPKKAATKPAASKKASKKAATNPAASKKTATKKSTARKAPTATSNGANVSPEKSPATTRGTRTRSSGTKSAPRASGRTASKRAGPGTPRARR